MQTQAWNSSLLHSCYTKERLKSHQPQQGFSIGIPGASTPANGASVGHVRAGDGGVREIDNAMVLPEEPNGVAHAR